MTVLCKAVVVFLIAQNPIRKLELTTGYSVYGCICGGYDGMCFFGESHYVIFKKQIY